MEVKDYLFVFDLLNELLAKSHPSLIYELPEILKIREELIEIIDKKVKEENYEEKK